MHRKRFGNTHEKTPVKRQYLSLPHLLPFFPLWSAWETPRPTCGRRRSPSLLTCGVGRVRAAGTTAAPSDGNGGNPGRFRRGPRHTDGHVALPCPFRLPFCGRAPHTPAGGHIGADDREAAPNAVSSTIVCATSGPIPSTVCSWA